MEEQQYYEEEPVNKTVPVYTEQDVQELISSMQQPEGTNKQMLNNMTPELLNTLVDKDEFRDTELLQTPHNENPDKQHIHLKKLSAFYNKTTALANTRREDFFHYRERLKDMKVRRMMSIREEDFTWDEDYLWGSFENWFELELTRSEGGFERLTQATQIQQNVQTLGNGQTQQPSGSILSGIGRMLGVRR